MRLWRALCFSPKYTMCNHQLNSIQALFASGPFRFHCNKCYVEVYRDHPWAVFPWKVLFIDRLGILFFLVVFLVFPYLPLVVLCFLASSGALYVLDVAKEPLKEYTQQQRKKQHKENLFVLVVLVALLTLSVVSYLWKT